MLNASWFMKHQPKKVDDLIFENNDHKKLITSWIDNEKLDGNVIFYGPPGLGKTVTSEILVYSIIKHQHDLFILDSRSVKDIDEKVIPFVRKSPIKSKHKIVFIEEIDRIKSQAAIGTLKNKILEKYQETTKFVVTTNYLNSVEDALLQRFTFKMSFYGKNSDEIINRLSNILEIENAIFDKDELEKYVTENIDIGIRELINQLQESFITNDGKINFETITQGRGLEENIISLIMTILNKVISVDIKKRKICCDYPMDGIISVEYSKLCAIVHNNYDVNYKHIYTRLFELNTFVPVKLIISKYSNQLDHALLPQANIIGCLYECMKSISELTPN